MSKESIFSSEKIRILLLLIVSFAISLLVATKDAIKLDEPVILEYFYTGMIHPDHQPMFYQIISIWSSVFGESDLGIRSFSILLFLITIPFFYFWIKKNSDHSAVPLIASILFISNTFILNHEIYAYFYSIAYLLTILSFLLSEDLLANKKTAIALTIINILGLLNFFMFSYVVISQLLSFVFLKQVKKIKTFFAINSLILVVYLIAAAPNIFIYRNERARHPDYDRSIFEFFTDMMGFDRWANLLPTKVIILISSIAFLFYLISIIFHFKQKHNLEKKYLGINFIILFTLSTFSFLAFKVLALRETEYRYFSFLTPFLIFFLASFIYRLKKRIRIFCLAIVSLIYLPFLFLYLSTQVYGSHDILINDLAEINKAKPNAKIYTSDVWVANHILTSLFTRQFPNEKLNIKFIQLQSLQEIQDTEYFLMYFQEEEFKKEDLPKELQIEDHRNYTCKNCDIDNLQLFKVLKK